MKHAAVRGRRPMAAIALLLGTAAPALLPALVPALLPAPGGPYAAGLVAAMLAIVIASTVGSVRIMPTGVRVGTQRRGVLERLVPRAAQSDPDARGHARPRAPGVLLPAV